MYYTAKFIAHFNKTAYDQQSILHEFYHHLVNIGIVCSETEEAEEVEADEDVKQFIEKGLGK